MPTDTGRNAVVERRHVHNGMPLDELQCPIALALNEGEDCVRYAVGGTHVRELNRNGVEVCRFRNRNFVAQFIRRFDAGRENIPAPFTVNLTVAGTAEINGR